MSYCKHGLVLPGNCKMCEVEEAEDLARLKERGGLPDTFDDYQAQSKATATYPRIRIIINEENPIEAPWLYPLLGLVGETGEIAEKFKKFVRDDHANWDQSKLKRDDVAREQGDALWYQARLAEAIEFNLSAIAKLNIVKLLSRKVRGVLQGSGDNR